MRSIPGFGFLTGGMPGAPLHLRLAEHFAVEPEDFRSLVEAVETGEVKKTARFVSRSPHWMPWVTHPVIERIEVGLFREFYDWPEAPSFALEWIEGSDSDRLEIRSVVDAWQTLPVMPELATIVGRASLPDSDGYLGADEVWEELSKAGFVIQAPDGDSDDALPLPPEEPRNDPIWQSEEADWLGPHVGRSFRFLGLVKQFLGALDKEDIVALDFRAGYRDSAFHRLWECMGDELVEERHIKASGRSAASEVPYLCTDTLAHLLAAIEDGQNAAKNCGVDLAGMRSPTGKHLVTLREPISSLVLQIWNAEGDEQTPIKAAARRVADKMGLVADFETYPHRIMLADNDEYREHGVGP